MNTFDNIKAVEAAIGDNFTSEKWIPVTQEMINTFAVVTGDDQWIHVDPERARKETPFGGSIAHGFLSLSMLPKIMMDTIHIKSARMGLNYGLNRVRWPHHLPAGSHIKAHFIPIKVDSNDGMGAKITWRCTIEIEGIKKPACVAELISLIFE